MSCDGIEPETLAVQLGVPAKSLRSWLRRQWPRFPEEHGARWSLSHDQVQAAIRKYGRKTDALVTDTSREPTTKDALPFGGVGSRLGDLMQRPAVDLVPVGESTYLEFKASARWNVKRGDRDPEIEETIVKSIAGFMNAQGGILLIGVDDDGQAVGLDRDFRTLTRERAPRDAFENWLTTLLIRTLGEVPVAICTAILFEELQGKDVCRVEVLPSADPVFNESRSGARFFARLHNSTRELDVRKTTEYIRRHWASVVDRRMRLPALSRERNVRSEPATPVHGGPMAEAPPQLRDEASKAPTTSSTLERQFHEAMVEIYKRAKKEAGYTATRFIQMVSGDGGLPTAKRLLHSNTPSDGFFELWKRGRLDLSVENYLLRPEFYPLFTEEERAIAVDRLRSYKFDPLNL